MDLEKHTDQVWTHFKLSHRVFLVEGGEDSCWFKGQRTFTYFVRGSITVRLTSCLDWLGFRCFAYVELARGLQVWLNPNQSNRRSAVQCYFPLQSECCLGKLFHLWMPKQKRQLIKALTKLVRLLAFMSLHFLLLNRSRTLVGLSSPLSLCKRAFQSHGKTELKSLPN